ncbi:hypothetical protein Rsub_04204 [Raphidocelis subcapitata]|uniref:Uncharacterized protein n=1 Tax=Raphidocelis subcapitata TaxID=307507 RepID=A0A2V0NV05_9CHLO|nr:hypothetical protein Rsub_04204 [Raphidocelis subcapitata]|eukprot:GBF91464.1 hypothetical protein Rsub_04204 [Raphidocelis subcapitata]
MGSAEGPSALKEVEAPAPPPPGARRQRWARAADAARAAALSPKFQLASQLAVGAALVSLYTLIDAVRFPGSCFCWTVFLVTSVIMSPEPHVGTRLRAVSSFLGNTVIAAVPAGLLCTLAELIAPAPSPAALALYCTLGPALLALLTVNRVAQSPPMLWAAGMDTLLIGGTVLIQGFAQRDPTALWRDSIGLGLLAAIAGACAVTLAVALLVLPTLASDQAGWRLFPGAAAMLRSCFGGSIEPRVRTGLAGVLQGAGASASRTAARLLCPPGALPGCGGGAPHLEPLLLGQKVVELLPGLHAPDEEADSEEALMQHYERKTAGAPPESCCAAPPPGGAPRPPGKRPAAAAAPANANGGGEAPAPPRLKTAASLGGVGPQTACSVEARGGPIYCLGPGLRAVELLLPAAASEPPWLLPARYDAAAFAALVAATARMLSSLAAFESILESGTVLNEALHHPAYVSALRAALAGVAASLARTAGALAASAGPRGASEAAALGAAAAEARAGWEEARRRLREGVAEEQEGYWGGLLARARGGTDGAPAMVLPLTESRATFFAYSAAQAAVDAAESLEAAARRALLGGDAPSAAGDAPPAGGAAAPPPRGSCFGWLLQLGRLFLGLALFANWRKVLGQDLPRALCSWEAVRAALRSRVVQAGLKIWAVLSALLVATFAAMQLRAELSQPNLNLLMAYVAAVLSMSERTEATASKVFAWLVSTAAGAAAGYGLMASPAAASPAALGAALSALSLSAGLLCAGQFQLTVVLGLMTFGSEVLCEYAGCCGASTASLTFFASRVVSVCAGVALSAAVSSFVAPWYTSSWALETMAAAYKVAAQLPASGYKKLRDDAAEAEGAASEAERAAAEAEGKEGAAVICSEAARNGGGADGGTRAVGGGGGAVGLGGANSNDATGAAGEGAQGPEAEAAADEAAFAAAPDFSEFCRVLRAQVAEPLTAVQASLILDTTLWQRGVYATPPIVPQLLHALLWLLPPLEAMVAALRPPDVSGRFVGLSFRELVVAPHAKQTIVLCALRDLAAAVERHLAAPTAGSGERLRLQIESLLRARIAARAAAARARVALHARVAGRGGDVSRHIHADDVVRAMGFMHAYIHALDRAIGVARVALRRER